MPEVAQRLQIGRLAVYAMLEQGILPGVRLGRRWIITRHAYEAQLRITAEHWTSLATRGNGVELLPGYKCKYASGTVLWYYKFQAPGAARGTLPIWAFGFASKKEASDAEARRRADEQQKHELAKAGSGVAAAPPKTLSVLLDEFFRQYAEKKLAPKTIERYHEQAKCLHPDLLAMPLSEITPLHLNREWNRLLQSGGRTRRDKKPRPLSAKSVRSIAGVVSSAFHRAVKWGLVGSNPVSNSEPPVPKKRTGIALLPTEQMLLIDAATGPWCLPMFLELSAASRCAAW